MTVFFIFVILPLQQIIGIPISFDLALFVSFYITIRISDYKALKQEILKIIPFGNLFHFKEDIVLQRII